MDKEDLSTVLGDLSPEETVQVREFEFRSMFCPGREIDERCLAAARQFADEHNCGLAFDALHGIATFAKRRLPIVIGNQESISD